jgi:hypothetical protein
MCGQSTDATIPTKGMFLGMVPRIGLRAGISRHIGVLSEPSKSGMRRPRRSSGSRRPARQRRIQVRLHGVEHTATYASLGRAHDTDTCMVPHILLLSAVLMWGWTFVATKILLAELGPIEVAAIRLVRGRRSCARDVDDLTSGPGPPGARSAHQLRLRRRSRGILSKLGISPRDTAGRCRGRRRRNRQRDGRARHETSRAGGSVEAPRADELGKRPHLAFVLAQNGSRGTESCGHDEQAHPSTHVRLRCA